MTQLVDGRYELIEVIGSGGMATVWRARDIKLERMVALKRPHPVPVGDPRHDRLAREARLSASINHPHLVTVHDAGSDTEGLYLVMELVNAPSLADAKGRLRREEIIEVGAQIGRALAAVHRAGVVHRDVKPGNILLAGGGAKLTDFGIATNGSGFGTYQPTTPGYFLATANYAAPEVLAGQPATPKSDIFALGVVLYELLAGRLPFNGADRSQRPATLNDPVGPVIDRCLSPYPGERPDGAELAGLLTSAPAQPIARRAVAAAAAAYDPTATSVMAPVPPSATGSSVVRPPTNTTVDPRAVAGTGSRPPGARRSPDPSTIALVVLGLGALLVVFILIRGAVNPDGDGTEIAATETADDAVDADSEPDTSVTVPSGSGDTEADGAGDEAAESDSGSDPGDDGSGGDDSGGGFGLGGGIIDRLRGVDDMINSVNDQIEELDAKAKDVRDIMKRINDAVELAGDAKPDKAAEKLEEAAEKADENLDGEARDRVFTLIEDVAEQLGVENIDLEQFRTDEG